MKKTLLFGALGFLLGAGSIGLALSNPFAWSWLPAPGTAMTEMAEGDAATATPPGERRIKYWQAPMDPTYIRDEPGKSPMGMDLIPVYEDEVAPPEERRIKYWRAPMDPTYIRDAPGKSPMGMDLIPVYEEDDASDAVGTVTIDPGFVQNMGVRTAHVMRADIPFTIRTVGNLMYDDSQMALVTTKYEGWIEKAYVNFIGQPVEQGQTLFDVYSPELVSAQEEYFNALDYAEQMRATDMADMARRAEAMLDAARRRLSYWDVSPEQIEELEASREPRRTLPIVAAQSGVVVWKMDQALEGMFVRAGMNLYRIADLSTIWAEAEVFENQMPWLKLGQRASIEVPSEPGRRLTGTVRYLHPQLSEETRALIVSIELPNPGARLRAGMYVDVTFDVPSAEQVLTVPEEAVIQSGTRQVVVIDLGEGRFQVREVELGVNGSGLWEIRTGVEEHDVVVVSAQFLIDSESNLREAIRKITSGEGSGSLPDAR